MAPPREIAGKYRVGELLGKGGRGEVYRGFQVELDREVAIKLLGGGADVDERERFLREAKVGAEIRHPGVAQVFDAGVTTGGIPYIAMELLEGQTLAERIAARGHLSAPEAVEIAADVCRALEAVHRKGYLHRDIKPSNIFLARRPDGSTETKLIDFGIAKRVSVPDDLRHKVNTMRGLGLPPLTAADVIVGTPCYLSPEQILGEPLDARTDIYALGVTLYEMLAGAVPFSAHDLVRMFEHILKGTVVKISRRPGAATVPAALEREIDRALSKAPADRHASAAEFATALERAMTEKPDAPESAATSPPATTARTPPPRRSRAAAPLVAAVLGAVLITTILAIFRAIPAREAPAATSALASVPATLSEARPEPTLAAPVAPAAAAPIAKPIATPKRAAPTALPAKTPPPPSSAPEPAGFRIDDLKTPY
jgi:eukaryotic-like serine/threonine-protein kinase